MKSKNGYISIETIIIAGLLIALAFVLITGLSSKINNIEQSQTSVQIVKPIETKPKVNNPTMPKESTSQSNINLNYDITINVIANIISGALTAVALFNYKKITALFAKNRKNKKKDII